MGYTELKRSGEKRGNMDFSLEACALAFIRESCEGLRFSEEKKGKENPGREEYLGTSLKENQIPYDMQMDIDRLCLEKALERFLKSGKKEDAFDVYFCYLEMFVEDYEKTRRMIELLSEFEATGSGLLMKHRDHYSHSVYVFALGLAIYQSNTVYQDNYKKYYKIKGKNAAAHHFLEYWGLASLFHDIGYPFELPFEQVCSYFEINGIEREKRPFVAYQELESFVELDKVMQRKIGKLYGLGTDRIIKTSDEFFAYVLSEKLSDIYYFSEAEILDVLRNKAKKPNMFNHYMDHAYFSATVLFKKLFCEMDRKLTKANVDALIAILLHNSLYKFSVAYYKDEGNIPFRMETHPLSFMLMLCDELQCWDRTAYGRNSKRELHPMGCKFRFTENGIEAIYQYDKNEKTKIKNFEERYENWAKQKEEDRGERPKLKAYSSMYIKKNGISDFQRDIEKIVNLEEVKLSVGVEMASRKEVKKNAKTYLSESNYINLYNFAVVLNGRWSVADEWQDAVEQGTEEEFLADENRKKAFAESFKKLSLEYKLSNINQAKNIAKCLNDIDCFYTDRPVDFEMLGSSEESGDGTDADAQKRKSVFSPAELDIIGRSEHLRWLQEHYDMGWSGIIPEEYKKLAEEYKNLPKEEKNLPAGKEKKKYLSQKRELLRVHEDMIPGYDGEEPVTKGAAEVNYKRLGKDVGVSEQEKDTDAMACMVSLLKMYDGVRIYKLDRTKENPNVGNVG